MNLHSINRRLDQLDARSPAPRRVVRLIVREEHETKEDAIARWCAENPDKPPPSDEDFIILNTIVSPNAKSA